MGTIPAVLLRDTITVQRYAGLVDGVQQFASPATLRAHVQAAEEFKAADRGGLTGAARGATQSRGWRIWIRPVPTVAPGSRVTCRGEQLTVVKAVDNDARGLPVPSHIELHCETLGLVATTTVTILRGAASTDAYGDLVDATTVVAAGLPASITEDRQTSGEPVDQRGGIVETYMVRIISGSDVREGDRIRDDRTAHLYRVLDVTYPHPTVGPELGTDDVMVTARRVSATSTPNE
jgi:hypothetical protein